MRTCRDLQELHCLVPVQACLRSSASNAHCPMGEALQLCHCLQSRLVPNVSHTADELRQPLSLTPLHGIGDTPPQYRSGSFVP